MYDNLNSQKALIWRIVHRDNVPWILDHGCHCSNSQVRDAGFVNIGNQELIDKRATREVPIPPGGHLSDYVPFYFTPFSPMMLNIKTGFAGIRQRANDEIVILVSSLHKVRELGLPFVFTDRHAYPPLARYFADLQYLSEIDWALLQRRDFKRDPDDPVKVERYQAEALIHNHLPIGGLLGLVCYSEAIAKQLGDHAHERGLNIKARSMPNWYFR